jgi:uncharacterized protein
MTLNPPIITDYQSKSGPVAPGERIQVLDILRGFALLGILTVNMQLFSTPIHLVLTGSQEWEQARDLAADALVRFFAHGKFYPIFSLLFGLGMGLQQQRAIERGTPFGRFHVRRLLALLGIGMGHAFLIWEGDILLVYALSGFLLLAFVNRREVTLVIWAVVCLMIPVLIMGAFYLLLLAGSMVPEIAREIDQAFAEQESFYRRGAEATLQAYGHGTYGEIFRQRLANLFFLYKVSIFYLPMIFGMFLLGLLAAKRGWLAHVSGRQAFFRKTLWWAGVIGLIGNTVFFLSFERQADDPRSFWSVAGTAGMSFGATALALCYISALALLTQHEWWFRRLAWLAPVGRMPLTNYLAQSLICTTIFYSYGLALFGKVGPAAGLLLALGIFSVQVLWSRWWMKRFQFGPAEWLWRRMTYGHW